MIFKGRVWKFGDNIDTDQIYPGKYLPLTDKQAMALHAMEGVLGAENFIKNVKPGDIIVGGKNFGCGSSREHAVVAIIGKGVSLIIAESFARIFYRNAINLALPVIECVDAKLIEEGDTVLVDTEKCEIVNLDKNERYQLLPLSRLELEIIKKGGLINYLRDVS
ncbi:MAG: 3-isopropylmalate dehydratase small subunit [bacterium]|nr:3-isopropylmalate dehydratase small subunit [bacterium]